jgi:hypothetical protein
MTTLPRPAEVPLVHKSQLSSPEIAEVEELGPPVRINPNSPRGGPELKYESSGVKPSVVSYFKFENSKISRVRPYGSQPHTQ